MNSPTFPEFFSALWGYDPFPWQSMLAERVSAGDWPSAIDLPTAAGKTACIDVAIHALAVQADISLEERTAPRRIWFVVDRRIVVDEAFSRAEKIARTLEAAESGPLHVVAEKLRQIGGLAKPLAVGRLRGGVIRDDGWARLPAQPAVLTSTVDQVGSRLLFRGYGQGDSLAPIHAGLAANDSLILLDEAHCANPFQQTLQSIRRLRGPEWAREPLPLPFQCSILSATLAETSVDDRFPKPDERRSALEHPILHQRARASKYAELAIAKAPGKPKKNKPSIGANGSNEDLLVLSAAQRALEYAVSHERRRIAVTVNRVATAQAVHQLLERTLERLSPSETGEMAFEPILLTGRMRPRDRERLTEETDPYLRSANPEDPARPIILVTTQCLEVGADYSFDALVTECASLDALRQRFGRLDRQGNHGDCPALILIRQQDTKAKAEDPVYGTAMAATWQWLDGQNEGQAVDFGIESMDAALPEDSDERAALYVTPDDAPILLPTHLDLLVQTSPRPDPEPDIDLFLHGKGRRSSEVRVLWRCDLTLEMDSDTEATEWVDTLALLPPSTRETLSVPLHRLKRWLGGREPADDDADVQGTLYEEDSSHPSRYSRIPFLLWRGREHSSVTRNLDAIRPGDTVALPSDTSEGMGGLGHAHPLDGLGVQRLDIAEIAARHARPLLALRLTPTALQPWSRYPALHEFFAWLEETEGGWTIGELRESLGDLFNGILHPAESGIEVPEDLPDWPEWLLEHFQVFAEKLENTKASSHPFGGLYLTLPLEKAADLAEEDPLGDEDDLASRSSAEHVTLAQHTCDVVHSAKNFASHCLTSDLLATFEYAARCHDLGKLDPRFQLLLHNGDEAEAASGKPLAKSDQFSLSARRRQRIREQSRLPRGFRHEQLSVELMRRVEVPEEADADLSAHLCAGHHGYARPFVPAIEDPEPPTIDASQLGLNLQLAPETRKRPWSEIQSETLESFARLNPRFGWWGLAMLEATFRLADWHASRYPGSAPESEPSFAPLRPMKGRTGTAPSTSREVLLAGLDGANPLAYLAALGTLRTVALHSGGDFVRMRWIPERGGWRPQLLFRKSISDEELVEILHRRAVQVDRMFSARLLEEAPEAGPRNKKGERSWADKLVFPVEQYREFLREAVAKSTVSDMERVQWAASWAGETVVDTKNGVETTTKIRFDFTAGQQAFIGMLRDSREEITPENVRAALFGPWRYSDSATSLRWDPLDEKRQYALQAFDPTNGSANPSLADPGANFLAIEGLAFYPFASDRRARQPGFSGGRGDNRVFQWPIWTPALGTDAVRLLLGHTNTTDRFAPQSLGIDVLLRSAIVQPSGRYRCFTPARAV